MVIGVICDIESPGKNEYEVSVYFYNIELF